MAKSMSIYTLFLLLITTTTSLATYNILDYGARPDGQTDSAEALLGAWADACRSPGPASVTVPAGTFFVSQASLIGPCNNNYIRVFIDGDLIAPYGYTMQTGWLEFRYVDGVYISGGTLNGNGQRFWNCKLAGNGRCPQGATSLRINMSKNVFISGMTLLNSENFHMVVFGSNGVTVQGTRIMAPSNSPNTDGIHIQRSTGVTITGSTIGTGDDCVSLGEGASNVWIDRVNCGPGHGISIGSLGGNPGEAGVKNITVTDVVFSGTENGVRIKTWGKGYSGYVGGVTFEHVIMQNVQNPIVIDQNYCPGRSINCPGQNSGVQIVGVNYNDIKGSSATQVAMRFDCSPSNPCSGIGLQDIKLTYQNLESESFCKNAHGRSSGYVSPKACIL